MVVYEDRLFALADPLAGASHCPFRGSPGGQGAFPLATAPFAGQGHDDAAFSLIESGTAILAGDFGFAAIVFSCHPGNIHSSTSFVICSTYRIDLGGYHNIFILSR